MLFIINRESEKESTREGIYTESTSLVYTGLLVELEHLKIKTTLIDEMFASVMGECVFLK